MFDRQIIYCTQTKWTCPGLSTENDLRGPVIVGEFQHLSIIPSSGGLSAAGWWPEDLCVIKYAWCNWTETRRVRSRVACFNKNIKFAAVSSLQFQQQRYILAVSHWRARQLEKTMSFSAVISLKPTQWLIMSLNKEARKRLDLEDIHRCCTQISTHKAHIYIYPSNNPIPYEYYPLTISPFTIWLFHIAMENHHF